MKSFKIRPWMLAYAVGMLALFIIVEITAPHRPSVRPFLLRQLSTCSGILLFVGNFLYAFTYSPRGVRTAWKFVFPLTAIDFILELFYNWMDPSQDPTIATAMRTFATITMIVLFFPTFRAGFLLGYGRLTLDTPPDMSDDPIHQIVGELRAVRKTTRMSWIIVIALLGALLLNSYLQIHFEPGNDSWVTVRRLADRAQYQEALAVARRLAAKDPDSPQTLMLMGSLQLSLGQLHEAEKSVQRANELLPNEATTSLLNAIRKRIDTAEPTPTPQSF
jgi:hypothetical protein